MSATDVCIPSIVKIEKCTEDGKEIDYYVLYVKLNVYIIVISMCLENGFSFIYVLKKNWGLFIRVLPNIFYFVSFIFF